MYFARTRQLCLRSALDLESCVLKIGFRDHIVPVENAARLVAADAHGDSLRQAASDKVPDRRPAQIVEQKAGHLCGFRQSGPCSARVSHRLSTWPREQEVVGLFAPDHRGDELITRFREGNCPALAVLRFAGIEPDAPPDLMRSSTGRWRRALFKV